MYNLFVAEKAKETTLFQSTFISKKDCCKFKACINVKYILQSKAIQTKEMTNPRKVNNLACKNLFVKLNSKAKFKQSHVSLSLLNDNRKEECLVLRAGGTR